MLALFAAIAFFLMLLEVNAPFSLLALGLILLSLHFIFPYVPFQRRNNSP